MIKLVQLETCESTNDEAWKHLPEPTLVVARHQTRGRGRQGRKWEDDEGNLMASYAFVPPEGLAPNFLWLPLAAGVAAFEAITQVCRESNGLRLKWPNDVMWEKAKLGGLLCESKVVGETLSGVVVGFGLNIARAPQVPEMETACLAERGKIPEDARGKIVGLWVERLQFWIEELALGRTERLREQWTRAAKLDRFPELKMHDRNGALVKVKALELDENGKLKAKLDTKIVHLDQADSI